MKTTTVIPISLALLAATANGLVIPNKIEKTNTDNSDNSDVAVAKKGKGCHGMKGSSHSSSHSSSLKKLSFESATDLFKQMVESSTETVESLADSASETLQKNYHFKQEDIKEFISKLKDQIAKVSSKSENSPKDLATFLIQDLVDSANSKGVEGLEVAPMINKNDFNPNQKDTHPLIPNRYMVVFKKNASLNEIMFHQELINSINLDFVESNSNKGEDYDFAQPNEFGISSVNKNGGIENTFNIAGLLQGYVGYFTKEVVDIIRMIPIVDYIEQDSMVFASDFDTQNGAPWGLARISHREKLNLGSFNKYLFDDDAGKGVTAYVVDTGINVKHEQFEGRARWGATMPVNDEDEDGNGHGTHCAGTIASKDYGVAKNADLVAVKVLRSNGSGTMSDVVRGVEYVANAHTKASKDPKNKNFKGSTANMSLGGGKSPSLDLAVNAAVDAGLHFAVAAGNENQDACNTSPASADKAITVGASTLSDARAYFSNYGSCVDIFAPGLNILSTYIGSDSATAVLSGTSMASPHVAGLLTYFLSLQPDKDSAFYDESLDKILTPKLLKQKIVDFATEGVLEDVDAETPNLLIYNGAGEDLSEFWSPKKNKSLETQENEYLENTVEANKLGSQFSIDSLVESLGDSTDNLFEDVRHALKNLNIL